ncbi:dihydrolipoamide acetyltransferase family protein [Arthrobacter sp. JSM 101049]|uniref:dihydrolipoamide acetyltransferase family protein n=1 Tax=Arthrobacter sp. JSM 101049 TaxID=929097 RepID=UPI003562D040
MSTVLKVFKLPDLGEGLTESEIVNWKVAVGETVQLNQVIAEVETAKAVVELPSPYSGVVTELHEQPGTVVEVGNPIVTFDVPGDGADDDGADDAGPAAAEEASGGPAQREPTLVGYGAAVETGKRPARKPRPNAAAAETTAAAAGSAAGATGAPVPAEPVAPDQESARAAEPSAPAPSAPATGTGERPRCTPPVRKFAHDLGIDLERVTGTGPYGLITRDDVTAAQEQGARHEDAAPSAAVSPQAAEAGGGVRTLGGGPREVRTPIKGIRKHTAQAMVDSAFTAPHATEFLTIDVTPMMELLERLRADRAYRDVKLTPLTIAAKAVCIALERQPTLNSRWDAEAQEIVQLNYVNLGIAAATPRGLMVPNLKDAQGLDFRALATALGELAATAKAGKTAPENLRGGTFSITNIGVFGIDGGTPILNPGEAGILALGQVREQPWGHRGEVVLRQVTTLSLSFDHRLVDGEQGSRFLADVGTIMADPGMLITML